MNKASSNGFPKCRLCNKPLNRVFIDLGLSPLSNAYLTPEQLNKMEPFFPLRVYVCDSCFLVQLEEFQTPSIIFSNYTYFSSYSSSWLAHARNYAMDIIDRFSIDKSWQVVEIASNDGYLLRNFKEANIPAIGIEPARNVAEVAEKNGIPTIVKFFGVSTAEDLVEGEIKADLLIGNNVLAHVPQLNDFVAGMKILLSQRGIITMEFPHLMQMMQNNQFDTIYHEHFSYLSLLSVENLFSRHGLTIFDVDELPTHGGSLRIYARHNDNHNYAVTGNIENMRRKEREFGLDSMETYDTFEAMAKITKCRLLETLIRIKREGKTITGYGAPAKGNTLLNYCGIRSDFIDYTVDMSPHKQGLHLPGTRIPIYHPEKIKETQPDYLLVLPWNLKDEIMEQTAGIRKWGGKYIVPIPEVRVYS
jgi:hypothetical protein